MLLLYDCDIFYLWNVDKKSTFLEIPTHVVCDPLSEKICYKWKNALFFQLSICEILGQATRPSAQNKGNGRPTTPTGWTRGQRR